MPKATLLRATNGAEIVRGYDLPDRLSGAAVVVKVEVNGAYVWPGGKAPEGGVGAVLHIGDADPAVTPGGHVVENSVWFDTST